ncbi:MAG: hypothetical protein ACT452_01085 [Microthrixaceae bacterium]
MTRKPTGAERYLADQLRDPEFRATYEAARQAIDAERAALRADSDSGS